MEKEKERRTMLLVRCREVIEIFAVSLDDSKDDWIEAIGEDKLTWNHVSDLKGRNSTPTLIRYGTYA